MGLLLGIAMTVAAGPANGQSSGSATVEGEKRLALVIGNGTYPSSPLRNPTNDAKAMARALRAAGFDVLEQENAGQTQMKRAIREFGDRLRQSQGVGLFYFAGHGLQVNGRNYLIPVDAAINAENEVEEESVDVANVLARMETAGNRLNIVILDACRDNPFARSWRSSARGLASISAARGTLIAYATAPGSVAADGSGQNGVFTGALLKAMSVPGLKIEDVFKRVRLDVSQQTGNKQVPWESSSLVGDFMFASPVAVAPATASTGERLRGYGPAMGSLRLGLSEADVHAALGERLKLYKEYRSFITHSADNFLFHGDRGLLLVQIDKQKKAVTELQYVLEPASTESATSTLEVLKHWASLERPPDTKKPSDGISKEFPDYSIYVNHSSVGAKPSISVTMTSKTAPKPDDGEEPLRDMWTGHDIAFEALIARAKQAKGILSEFHGVYGPCLEKAFLPFSREISRLSRVLIWSEDDRVFVKWFQTRIGSVPEAAIKKDHGVRSLTWKPAGTAETVSARLFTLKELGESKEFDLGFGKNRAFFIPGGSPERCQKL